MTASSVMTRTGNWRSARVLDGVRHRGNAALLRSGVTDRMSLLVSRRRSGGEDGNCAPRATSCAGNR
jgi:hypothetical protein